MNKGGGNEALVSFYFFGISLIIYAAFWFIPVLFPFKSSLILGFSSALYVAVGGTGLVILFALARGRASAYVWIDQAMLLFFLLLLSEFILSAMGIPEAKSAPDIERDRITKNNISELIHLIDDGERAYHHVTINDLSNLPYLSGFEDQNIVFQEEEEGLIKFHTDENGFRNKSGKYSALESIDIVTLGDSFAHGCCVPDGYTLADKLGEKTGKTVYNLGYSGTGLVYSISAYMEYAELKNPKYVVLQVLEGASYARVESEVNSGKYDAYLKAAEAGTNFSRGLGNQSKEQKDEKEKYIWSASFKSVLTKLYDLSVVTNDAGDGKMDTSIFSRGRAQLESLNIYRFFQQLKATLGNHTPHTEKYPNCENFARGNATYKAATTSMRYLAQQSQNNGGNLIIVFQPSFRWIQKDFPECGRDFYRSFARQNDAIFIDLVDNDSMQKNPFEFYYSLLKKGWPHAHFNRAGFDLAATTVADVINTHK